ncbi:glycosyltransferase [Gimesia sp.]|uniref:glycosyltransferase n=1 Tax=Gimesia sp. TaxID=2024833 RepID=UPI003A933428
MPQVQTTHRFLVYVVAYEAEQHLYDLFERIPYELFNRSDFHFLVSDDASSDNGPVVLKEWLEAHEIYNVTILKNRVNQGYGGNQKTGMRVAVDDGYSCLILLHGDGQYSPELLSEFARVWSESEPDVILGSRMHSAQSAREGGMPYYKILGNRILTTFQNRMTGWELSEYHTGYRAYATKFLDSVPFEINTNDFHFDTEILLQAAHVNASVKEINIPTYYGDEVCRVSGFKYAWNVFTATLQYKMHQLGMLCSLKLRNLSTDRYRDKTHALYSSHALALQLLDERQTKRVLDIGCGPGHIAARCEQAGMHVTGIDCAVPLSGSMSEFHIANLEHDELPVSISKYDTVLLMDVIEHLADPEAFLLRIRNQAHDRLSDAAAYEVSKLESALNLNQFESGSNAEQSENNEKEPSLPAFIISTPNIAFAAVRINLLLGRFNYAERGILDITHKRLFTRKSLLQMLRDCGYEVDRVRGVGVPFAAVMAGRTGRCLGWLANLSARIWPSLFAFQFLVECRPRPGVKDVLRNAIRIHDLSLEEHGESVEIAETEKR